MNPPCAEIIESSLSTWIVQSWKWDTYPPFGSLVTIQEGAITLFGIIYQIKTGSSNPVYVPIAHQQTENELLRNQPHIFNFLQTTLTCLNIGYHDNGIMIYQHAPRPPKIHAHLRCATIDEYRLFFSSEQYLHLLFNLSNSFSNLDELLLALLKNLGDHQVLSPECIKRFIKTFSLLTGNDYRRLKLFLQRAHPIVIPHLTPQGSYV